MISILTLEVVVLINSISVFFLAGINIKSLISLFKEHKDWNRDSRTCDDTPIHPQRALNKIIYRLM